MATKAIAVMGATGNIGHVLVQELLKKGHIVKAIGRNKNKLNALKKEGAEVYNVDKFDNANALSEVFKGCEAVFTFLPPLSDSGMEFQDKISDAIKTAIEKNNIRYVINLSSIGANHNKDTGPIVALHRLEQRLNGLSNAHVLHFRPSFFMENFYWSIPLIKLKNIIGMPVRPDLTFPLVSTKDIGTKIAELFDRLDFKGHTVYEFSGPRDMSMKEITSILGKALGKEDLKYVQFSFEDFERGMIAQGTNPNNARTYNEMYKFMNDGRFVFLQKLPADHHGKTTLEQWAKEFAHAFKSDMAHA